MKTNEDKLEALALSMPDWDETVIQQYREDPELGQLRIASEFKEYLHTGEMNYLLSTLYKVAEAKGWSKLARETGISRPTLYAVLSGAADPRVSTLMKILGALGVRVYTDIAPNESTPWKGKTGKRKPLVKRNTSKPKIKAGK